MLVLLALRWDLGHVTGERSQRARGGRGHGTALPRPLERGDDAVGWSHEAAGRQIGDDERARSEVGRLHAVAVVFGNSLVEREIVAR